MKKKCENRLPKHLKKHYKTFGEFQVKSQLIEIVDSLADEKQKGTYDTKRTPSLQRLVAIFHEPLCYFKKSPENPLPPEDIFWQHQNSFSTENSKSEKVGPINLSRGCTWTPLGD